MFLKRNVNKYKYDEIYINDSSFFPKEQFKPIIEITIIINKITVAYCHSKKSIQVPSLFMTE